MDKTIAQIGQDLNIGNRDMHKLLRTLKITNDKNLPLAKFKGMGLFKIAKIPVTINNQIVVKKKTLLTPKGAEWLKRKFSSIMEVG